jgi:hypothetical protein
MKVTKISVRYGRTHNLGDYNNVRPEIELTAELALTDDVDEAIFSLATDARVFVEEAIDDALEQHNRPAFFSQEQRYDVILSRSVMGRGEPAIEPKTVAIIPTHGGTRRRAPNGYYASDLGVRLDHAKRLAGNLLSEDEAERLVVCVYDHNLTDLPALPREPEDLPFDDSAAAHDAASDAALNITDILGEH